MFAAFSQDADEYAPAFYGDVDAADSVAEAFADAGVALFYAD